MNLPPLFMTELNLLIIDAHNAGFKSIAVDAARLRDTIRDCLELRE
jgi:hypothetical protein